MRFLPYPRLVVGVAWVAAVFALSACDKTSGGGGTSSASAAATSASAPKPSASVSASTAPSASASADPSVTGACAALAKDKTAYCDRLSGGDPTVKMTCQEGVDALVKAGDDAKCKAATAPSTKKPSDDPDPD